MYFALLAALCQAAVPTPQSHLGFTPGDEIALELRQRDVRADGDVAILFTDRIQCIDLCQREHRRRGEVSLRDPDADIRRAAFTRHFKNHYVIHFHHAKARYDLFSYPLENVEGDLDIQEDSWEFRTEADEATKTKPGYPECVAMIVQIGDYLSKQFDVKG